MAIRQQFVEGDGDPCVVTIAAATAGNILFALVSERSGTGHANQSVSDDGTAWTKHFGFDYELGDSTNRFSFSLWSKVADAGQDTTISMDDDTGNSKYGWVAEYELEGGEVWGGFLGSNAAGASSVGSDESLGTGNTPSISGTDFLVLSMGVVKCGNNTPSWNQPNDWIRATDGENDEDIHFGGAHGIAFGLADQNDNTTGARSDTVAFDSSNSQVAFSVAIAAFDLSAGGGTAVSKDGAMNASGAVGRHFVGSREVAGEI